MSKIINKFIKPNRYGMWCNRIMDHFNNKTIVTIVNNNVENWIARLSYAKYNEDKKSSTPENVSASMHNIHLNKEVEINNAHNERSFGLYDNNHAIAFWNQIAKKI